MARCGTGEAGCGNGPCTLRWASAVCWAEVWRGTGPRCWASGRAGALGCCTSLAGPLGWGKEVAGRDWAWAWSLPGLTVWAGRRVCGLGCSRVWAGLAIGLFPSSFLLQTSLKLFEFKLKFESNPTTLKQVKLCNGMNAQTVSPKINFNYLRIKIRLNESLNTINLRNLIKTN